MSVIYYGASFALGGIAGLSLALFSALPFILGVAVGFCSYELNPDAVKSLRGRALAQAHLALGALRELRPRDFAAKVVPSEAAEEPEPVHVDRED